MAHAYVAEDLSDRVDMVQLLVDIGFSDVDPDMEEQLLYCVFHNDSATPSFSVNLQKKVFHCFSSACGLRGSAVTLYSLWKQIPYAQAREELQYLPRRRDVDMMIQKMAAQKPAVPVTERMDTLTEFAGRMPLLSATEHAQVLLRRGISRATMDTHKLRWFDAQVAESMDQERVFRAGLSNVWKYHVLSNHPVLFPFSLGASVVFIQGRQAVDDPTRPKYLGSRGGIPCLWNHNALRQRPELVYLTEGVIDSLSLEELGYGPAVGIVGTEGFKADWAEDFRGVKCVMLALDNDAAGNAACTQLAPVFRSVGCRVDRFQLPAEFKDINEFLCRQRKGE